MQDKAKKWKPANKFPSSPADSSCKKNSDLDDVIDFKKKKRNTFGLWTPKISSRYLSKPAPSEAETAMTSPKISDWP